MTTHQSIRILFFIIGGIAAHAGSAGADFKEPAQTYRPETWFHLIGGNVDKTGLTADLEAIQGAGIQGIQLFHGRGGNWPGVDRQIQTLSPTWDSMIEHVANETRRLDLRFTMQNCPGWATSGGPWITPDNTMRHLIWSRHNVQGGQRLSLRLDTPQPSAEDWRDYRDVAVLAFPTPEGDSDPYLTPAAIRSNRDDLPWMDLVTGKADTRIELSAPNIADWIGRPLPKTTEHPAWIEVDFPQAVNLRAIEFPPVSVFVRRQFFDPATVVQIEAKVNGRWVDVISREVPRASWQDRQPWVPLVLALPDRKAQTFRITFIGEKLIELNHLRFLSAARSHDWRGQAGYALRSMDRSVQLVQDPAAWVRHDSIIDLSDRMAPDGTLSWQAPRGDWTVVRFGHVNTGEQNKPAPREATGFECDKLSASGIEQHFAGYVGRVAAPGGPADGGRLHGVLIDSWEAYTQTWTPRMESEFEAFRGYALRQWLPALAGWVVEDHLTSERFLRDWRATINDLLVQNYYGRFAELAHEHGLELYFETAVGDVMPGDILQYYSKADVPMAEFWLPNNPVRAGAAAKPFAPVASAAHIYGKQRVGVEAYTNGRLAWNEHLFRLKYFTDYHFTLGINHFIFHTYTHNPLLDAAPGTSFGSRIGTPFLRGQTWWKHMPLFTDYLARCQFLLQKGQPVADVLWYLGDDFDHMPLQSTPFPEGYRFDYLNQDVLLNRLEVVDGKLQTPEGTSWKVLWLPEEQCRRMTPETLVRLRQLLQEGATVIGGAPLETPTLSGGESAERAFTALVRELWGEPASRGHRRIGQGQLLWGHDLEFTLSHLNIAPDVIGNGAATWFHRRSEDKEIYFISAGRLAPLSTNMRFRAQGRPELWDPLTGKVEPVVIYHQESEHTVIPLDLPAAGSVFVVFHNEPSHPPLTAISRDGQTLVDASDLTHVDKGTPMSIYGVQDDEDVQPWVETPMPSIEALNDGRRFVAWEDGNYAFKRGTRTLVTSRVSDTRTLTMAGPWTLNFPAGWDIPEQVDLPELQPWSALADRATRAFSGTATYTSEIELDRLSADSRVLLDLGRVEQVAEVSVNGQRVAAMWAPPFRLDITPYVRTGSNRIEVKVTNTWRNRLAYDASLPEAQRKTWAIHTPGANAPVEPAGLIGPVKVRIGEVI
ncbi:MAG: hypothetical protein EA353_05430, partial [Puniceicoccaceae bacterium]